MLRRRHAPPSSGLRDARIRLAVLRRLPPPPKRQRSLAALRALLLAACALLLLVKTSTTLARALARAFAPSVHLASAPSRAPRRLFTPPSAAMAPMKVLAVRTAKRTYPTGDPSFAVKQAFPAGLTETESDPFLMCDYFGPTASEGLSGVDEYPVGWHPHRGFDICTYLTEGVGRHADSLGNRETFSAPGMQWCSVGSGIEHAEAGGTPAGDNTAGFQIWVNVPSARKMDDPRYGTVPSDALAAVQLPDGVVARVLAGPLGGAAGPFKTVQEVSMVHYEMPAGRQVTHEVGANLDNAIIYVFRGSVQAGGPGGQATTVEENQVARFDASDAAARGIALTAGPAGAGVMLFAGKMLRQPIAWRGPIVMTTDEEVRQAYDDLRSGNFPPVRAPFNYRKLSAFPADHPAREGK